jgi:hypothetical protein
MCVALACTHCSASCLIIESSVLRTKLKPLNIFFNGSIYITRSFKKLIRSKYVKARHTRQRNWWGRIMHAYSRESREGRESRDAAGERGQRTRALRRQSIRPRGAANLRAKSGH